MNYLFIGFSTIFVLNFLFRYDTFENQWLNSTIELSSNSYYGTSMFVDNGENICDLPPLPLPTKSSTSISTAPGIAPYIYYVYFQD